MNAANKTLLGGGGIDGAIHRAAGPELLQECKGLGGCETGQAKITRGYKLPARYVIHTVGPVWSGGHRREPELLQSCYRKSMESANAKSLRTIAFPSISTGVYRFPIDRASAIALTTVRECLKEMKHFVKVIFVCFSETDLSVYQRTLVKAPSS